MTALFATASQRVVMKVKNTTPTPALAVALQGVGMRRAMALQAMEEGEQRADSMAGKQGVFLVFQGQQKAQVVHPT